MRTTLAIWLLWLVAVTVTPRLSSGDDRAAVADELRKLGAQVTESGGTVSKVMLRDCSTLGDAEFRKIGQLADLKSLTLYGKCQGLNDETLAHLCRLTGLEELSTDGIQVTDAGLKQLAALTNLRSLAFFHISFRLQGFTGAGFAHLKSLPRLERLTVAGTTFNDEGMAALGQLTQLKELRSWHTFQTQAGNERLVTLVNLRSLHLGQRLRKHDGKPCPVSLDDATLATLARMKSLESLTLDEVRLTQAGLIQLKGLPNLKKLSLQRAEISDTDLAAIRTELPSVTVEWKPLTEAEHKALETLLRP